MCIIERLFSSSLVAMVELCNPRKLRVCHFKVQSTYTHLDMLPMNTCSLILLINSCTHAPSILYTSLPIIIVIAHLPSCWITQSLT